MRRRTTIQLFSTSSIDLLACGLGAVLVLWLLVFGNEGGAYDGDRPLGAGEMRIRQFGVSHLMGFQIPPSYVLERIDYRRANGTEVSETVVPATVGLFEDACSTTGQGERFVAHLRETGGTGRIEIGCKASEAFAKEVAIRFEEMTGGVKVEFVIESCKASEVHYLEMQKLDRRGVNEDRYVFHCASFADRALAPDRTPQKEWEENFLTQIQSELGTMCPRDPWPTPFRYRVYDCSNTRDITFEVSFSGDGLVRLVEPDMAADPVRSDTLGGSPIREWIAGWAAQGSTPVYSAACP
ncbi:hypothetical protein ACNKFW_02000 [Paracoccus sp. TD-10]|uniref:hypothetical protein n=1 Tax=Paracoccus sp. TD-10 TaxID=3395918 RepID=UPI003AAED679